MKASTVLADLDNPAKLFSALMTSCCWGQSVIGINLEPKSLASGSIAVSGS